MSWYTLYAKNIAIALQTPQQRRVKREIHISNICLSLPAIFGIYFISHSVLCTANASAWMRNERKWNCGRLVENMMMMIEMRDIEVLCMCCSCCSLTSSSFFMLKKKKRNVTTDSSCNEMNIIDCYMPLEQTKIARKIKWRLFGDELCFEKAQQKVHVKDKWRSMLIYSSSFI